MTTSPSTFGDITLCLRNGSKCKSAPVTSQSPTNTPAASEPVDVRERKRRYSQELYRYTMQMWDQNRADIECVPVADEPPVAQH